MKSDVKRVMPKMSWSQLYIDTEINWSLGPDCPRRNDIKSQKQILSHYYDYYPQN